MGIYKDFFLNIFLVALMGIDIALFKYAIEILEAPLSFVIIISAIEILCVFYGMIINRGGKYGYS